MHDSIPGNLLEAQKLLSPIIFPRTPRMLKIHEVHVWV